MDSSIKQFVSVVIAVLVGAFMITYVSSGDFKGKITNSIDGQIDSIVDTD